MDVLIPDKFLFRFHFSKLDPCYLLLIAASSLAAMLRRQMWLLGEAQHPILLVNYC
jgi:hypothetical protein